jgi:DNA-binding Lrp family transcriptional regulator
MNKLKENHMLGSDKELHTLVLVALSPRAHRDPQKIADKLTKCREVECIDILAGNWDLALEVKTESQEELYDFLKRLIYKEGEATKTNSLISLKRIRSPSS